jgi:hypothetical protein
MPHTTFRCEGVAIQQRTGNSKKLSQIKLQGNQVVDLCNLSITACEAMPCNTLDAVTRDKKEAGLRHNIAGLTIKEAVRKAT